MKELTQERLKELLHYDQETGVFIWKIDRSRLAKKGNIAGCFNYYGYIDIKIDGKTYKANRLVWIYVYGKWPKYQIDHIDNIRHHNWIKNLREATHSQNQQNQIKAKTNNKSTGLLGSYLNKIDGTFRSQIRLNGKSNHLGVFETDQEAHTAYIDAKRKHHEFCTI
jgi:hypothetical protein